MARALARGWDDPVLVSDAGSGRAAALVAELGGETVSNAEVADRADLVILCHKPAQLLEVARELERRPKAVASVLAVTSVSTLSEAYPDTPVFRLAPNVASEVRRGVTVYAKPEPNRQPDPELEQQVLALFHRLGIVVKLPERLMDAAGAVSAVGPAYQALLVEAQVDAAVRHGLEPRVASEMVVQTMTGAAALLEERDHDTLSLRREVTSPGGTTARGLEALERCGIRSAFQAAIDAVRSAR